VIDYNIYAAFDDGVVGYNPTYGHGIIVEISNADATTAAVFCFDCPDANWKIINLVVDEVEVLSRGGDE
jgi:hypothetical protein